MWSFLVGDWLRRGKIGLSSKIISKIVPEIFYQRIDKKGKKVSTTYLKGVFSDQMNMCGIVAFSSVIITAFSFFHDFLSFFKGKHSSHIFGSQRLFQYNLPSTVPAISYSCGLGMWKL